MYVLVPLAIIAAGALAWSWWSGRVGRDPTTTVHSFHRALEAMQPSGAPRASDGVEADDAPEPSDRDEHPTDSERTHTPR